MTSADCFPGQSVTPHIPLRRRLRYLAIIYLSFLLVLFSIEIITRTTLPHLSSLDLFVVTPQQKAQIANAQQSTIFEGDPLKNSVSANSGIE